MKRITLSNHGSRYADQVIIVNDDDLTSALELIRDSLRKSGLTVNKSKESDDCWTIDGKMVQCSILYWEHDEAIHITDVDVNHDEYGVNFIIETE
jgi:hypothetical protein